jgi:hypothetical protein
MRKFSYEFSQAESLQRGSVPFGTVGEKDSTSSRNALLSSRTIIPSAEQLKRIEQLTDRRIVSDGFGDFGYPICAKAMEQRMIYGKGTEDPNGSPKAASFQPAYHFRQHNLVKSRAPAGPSKLL